MKIRNLYKGKDFSFYTLEQLQLDKIKLAESMVPAGFPSPADDFVEMELNIHDYIVKNKDATFCVKVEIGRASCRERV